MGTLLSSRFGFVEFESTDDAQAALDAMQGQEIDGREVKLDFASEGGGGTPRGRGGRGGFGGRGKSFGDLF